MNLKKTIGMMCSDDYRERFKAEYFQVDIRYQKLKEMVEKWDAGELNSHLHVQEVLMICNLQR